MLRILLLLLVFVPLATAADPREVLAVKRVFVDQFNGENAPQLRDMIISSLQRSGLFVITENPDRADAVLRGSAEDLIFTEVFQSGESLTARVGVAAGRGAAAARSGREFGSLQAAVGEQENTRIQERKHEASAAVRLVNRDGDVIWSTIQESQGAKFRSASADVADKITRHLLADVEKLKKADPGAASGDVPR
ncbi:MAG: hypothetical protein KJZ84_14250 [Bryobacteraceae bacterium]|nr:hypothetical protein [Bryobacteraceae bacterium]